MERTEKTGILGVKVSQGGPPALPGTALSFHVTFHVNSYQVKVSQGGRDIWKHLWDDECRRNVYSASKSFTSEEMSKE